MTKNDLLKVFKVNLADIENVITVPTYISADYYKKLQVVLDYVRILLILIETEEKEQTKP